MSNCVVGKGTVVKVKIANVLTTIPGLKSVSGIQATGSKVDCTALDDASVQIHAGIPDLGDWKAKVLYDPSNAVHQYIRTSQRMASNTLDETFELTYNNAGPNKDTFVGHIIDFNVGMVDRNGAFEADFSVHVDSTSST